jgi:hypothetical protein
MKTRPEGGRHPLRDHATVAVLVFARHRARLVSRRVARGRRWARAFLRWCVGVDVTLVPFSPPSSSCPARRASSSTSSSSHRADPWSLVYGMHELHDARPATSSS